MHQMTEFERLVAVPNAPEAVLRPVEPDADKAKEDWLDQLDIERAENEGMPPSDSPQYRLPIAKRAS